MYSGELRNGSREICRGMVWFQEDSTFSLKTWKSMTLHKRDISFILNDGFSLSRDLRQIFFCYLFLDCEQSLFFFRFSKRAISLARGHLRVSRFARQTTEKRETARSLIYFVPNLHLYKEI